MQRISPSDDVIPSAARNLLSIALIEGRSRFFSPAASAGLQNDNIITGVLAGRVAADGRSPQRRFLRFVARLKRLLKKTLDVVIPSVARNLLFPATLKVKQVPQPGKHRRASE